MKVKTNNPTSTKKRMTLLTAIVRIRPILVAFFISCQLLMRLSRITFFFKHGLLKYHNTDSIGLRE